MSRDRLRTLHLEAKTIAERDEPEPDEITVRTLAGFVSELAAELLLMRYGEKP